MSAPYVFALSQKFNDLNQYRVYADDARGAMLVFSRDKLLEISMCCFYSEKDFAVVRTSDNKKPLELLELLNYGEPKTKFEKMYNRIMIGMQDCSPFFPFSNLLENKEAFEKYTNLISSIHHFILTFKDSAYNDEKEWRLIKRIKREEHECNLRYKEHTLIPYIKYKFDKDIIAGIGLAPISATKHANFKTLKIIKEQKGYKYGIAPSPIPYKN